MLIKKYLIIVNIIFLILIIYKYINYDNLKKTVNDVTPQTLLNLLNNKKVAIVNTLSNDFVINKNPTSYSNNFAKDFIDNKDLFDKFDKIVLYCANYSCGASHKYENKLIKKGVNKNKIIHYKGGIYEWAMLSILYPDKYSILGIKNNKLNEKELRNLIKNYSHYSEYKKFKLYGVKFPKILIENSPK